MNKCGLKTDCCDTNVRFPHQYEHRYLDKNRWNDKNPLPVGDLFQTEKTYHPTPSLEKGSGGEQTGVDKYLLKQWQDGNQRRLFTSSDGTQHELFFDETALAQNELIPINPTQYKEQPVLRIRVPIEKDPGFNWNQFLEIQDTNQYIQSQSGFGRGNPNIPTLPNINIGFAEETIPVPTTLIEYGIYGLIDSIMAIVNAFSGRPKEQATEEVAQYMQSGIPIFNDLGAGAFRLWQQHIPLSSPDADKIFGPAFKAAVKELMHELQTIGKPITLRAAYALMQQLLHAMANPSDDQHIVQYINNLYQRYLNVTQRQVRSYNKRLKPIPKRRFKPTRSRYA